MRRFEVNMKDSKSKVLHDPIAYKARGSDLEFAAPRKERATTGRYMSAGDVYGVGFRTPVGSERASGLAQGPIPLQSSAFHPDEAVRK